LLHYIAIALPLLRVQASMRPRQNSFYSPVFLLAQKWFVMRSLLMAQTT
jgi:hypothetical protein